jgi:hypothetical protein
MRRWWPLRSNIRQSAVNQPVARCACTRGDRGKRLQRVADVAIRRSRADPQPGAALVLTRADRELRRHDRKVRIAPLLRETCEHPYLRPASRPSSLSIGLQRRPPRAVVDTPVRTTSPGHGSNSPQRQPQRRVSTTGEVPAEVWCSDFDRWPAARARQATSRCRAASRSSRRSVPLLISFGSPCSVSAPSVVAMCAYVRSVSNILRACSG